MMKITIGVALSALALAAVAWAALPALAQTATPTPTTPSTAPVKPERGLGRHGGADWVGAAASVTGLTTAEVKTALQSGQSLAQIAESKGKTGAAVIAAARTALETALKSAVTAGTLTQAQAEAKLAEFDQTAEQIVATAGLGRPGGHPHGPQTPQTPATPGGASVPQPQFQLNAPSLDS
ncbi:MAG: hypothetical protein JNK29_07100 [Anaerolineales bacterium]|nr:hypothetical protein [Anaerolineales bacterium]